MMRATPSRTRVAVRREQSAVLLGCQRKDPRGIADSAAGLIGGVSRQRLRAPPMTEASIVPRGQAASRRGSPNLDQ